MPPPAFSFTRFVSMVALPCSLLGVLACSSTDKAETKPPAPLTTIPTPDTGTPKPDWSSVPPGITYYGQQAAVVLSEDGSTVLFFAANPSVSGQVNDALGCTAELDVRGANILVKDSQFSFPFRYYEYLFGSSDPTGSLSGNVVGTIAGDSIGLEVHYDLSSLCEAQGTATVQAIRMDDPCTPGIPQFASTSLSATVGQTLQVNLTATPVFKPLCSRPGAAGTIPLSLANKSGADASLIASEVTIIDGAGVGELLAGTHSGTANLVASSLFGTNYDAKATVTITDPCSNVGVTLAAAPRVLGLRPGESAKIMVDASLQANKCPNPSPVPLQMSVPGGVVTIATPDVQVSSGQATFDLVGATPGVATVTTKVADSAQRFVGAAATSRIEVNQHPLRALWQLPPESIAKSFINATATDGDTLYLAAGRQLQTVSIQDPRAPSFGPVLALPHAAYSSMAVAGPNLFVGYCDTTSDTVRTVVTSGVLAYRVGPDGLTPVGDVQTCPANSCVTALAVVGDRVVADCDSQNSLQVVDFQTSQVASVYSIGSSYSRAGGAVSAAGYVYYAVSGYLNTTQPSTVHVLALSDTGELSKATSLQLAQVCWGLAADGTTLHASCKDSKGNLVLITVDVSVPTAPVVVASTESTTRLLPRPVPIVRPNGVFVFAGGSLGALATTDAVSSISWFSGETPATYAFSAAESALNYSPIAAHGDSLIVRFDDNTIDGKLIGVVDLSTPP